MGTYIHARIYYIEVAYTPYTAFTPPVDMPLAGSPTPLRYFPGGAPAAALSRRTRPGDFIQKKYTLNLKLLRPPYREGRTNKTEEKQMQVVPNDQ